MAKKDSTLHVRLTDELLEKLKKIADKHGLPVSLVVRLLLDKGLKSSAALTI